MEKNSVIHPQKYYHRGEIVMKDKQLRLQLEAISDKMERLRIQKEFYEKLLNQDNQKEK